MNLEGLKEIFPKERLRVDEESRNHYALDWTTYYEPKASAVVFPETENEVRKLVEWARATSSALVPSGGRTGLSGGAVAKQGEVVVSFERMNRMGEFCAIEKSLEVEAGVVTDQIKAFAEDKGLQFPLSFGATGSSQIGGNLATNAGGANVLRYGNVRSWVLGLRVVTGRGEILDLNKALVKNATGYDLRHLFIGSEGSLGLITKACLKLAPKPKDSQVVFLKLKDWASVTESFALLSQSLSLLAYEVLDQACVARVERAGHAQLPFEAGALYVIFEAEKFSADFEATLEETLEAGFGRTGVEDAVIAQNPQQARELWKLREFITESISVSKPYKNDIAVRPSRIPDFVSSLEEKVRAAYPDFEVLWFGHVGDGNLHLNILRPESLSRDDFVDKCRSVDEILFSCVQDFGGSISAEHGLGLSKKDFLLYSRSAEEIEAMKAIKQIFDPDGILNPGKLFPEA